MTLVVEVVGPVWTPLNERMAQTIVRNLVENAIKYAGHGATATTTVRAEHGHAVLVVADDGAGIPERHLAHVFERFYRADPSRSKRLGGTGLGLSIVKHIAERFGGSASVASPGGLRDDDHGDAPARRGAGRRGRGSGLRPGPHRRPVIASRAAVAVPLMDIQAQYGPLRAEIDAAIAGVLDSGRFILGPEGRALEASVSERLDGRPCAGVANGTDALVIALNALDIGPGDEVITTPYTFYATAEAIARVGATPVFADIDPVTYCLDPEAAAREDRAGHQGDPAGAHLRPPGRHGGDHAPWRASTASPWSRTAPRPSARAPPRARSRTFGDVATFSFFPTKNFPGMGDGGMVVCRDEELAERVKRLRFHGSKDKVVFDEVGYNSRLDDLQAAIIRVFYPHLDGWNAAPRPGGAWYAEEGLGEVMTLPGDAPRARRHIYHLYMARHPRRDDLRAALSEAGVGERRLLRHPHAPAAGLRPPRLLRGRPAGGGGVRAHRARPADAPQPDAARTWPQVVAAARSVGVEAATA